MKTLSTNYTPQYCVEIVSYESKENGLMKFKLVSENPKHSNYRFGVYVFSKNYTFERVAYFGIEMSDIEGIAEISAYKADDVRIKEAKENIEIGKEWIKKVF